MIDARRLASYIINNGWRQILDQLNNHAPTEYLGIFPVAQNKTT